MRLATKVKVVNKKEKIAYNGIMFFNESFGFKSLFGKRYSSLLNIRRGIE